MKKVIYILLIFFIINSGCNKTSLSTDTEVGGGIKGKVSIIDSSDYSDIKIRGEIYEPNTHDKISGITNSNGIYFISNIKKGKWNIYFEKEGYATESLSVEINNGDIKTLDETKLTIKIEVETDKNNYSKGENVIIKLKATNKSNVMKEIIFPTGQQYDFNIEKNGNNIWRWSYNLGFTQAFTKMKINAGETKYFQETWNQRNNNNEIVETGIYKIFGMLYSYYHNKGKTKPIEITIQ